MAYFVETVSNAKGRLVNLYSGINAENLSRLVDEYFSANGYVKTVNGPGSVTYTKGNRVLRILFGAFVKYFRFLTAIKSVDADTVELAFSKDSSGMSGGAIGMSQVSKEFNKIKDVLQNI